MIIITADDWAMNNNKWSYPSAKFIVNTIARVCCVLCEESCFLLSLLVYILNLSVRLQYLVIMFGSNVPIGFVCGCRLLD